MKAAAAAGLALWLAAAVAAPASRAQTFTSGVNAVRVDVLVTVEGQPLRGLRAGDFEIRDNGVLQQVDLVSFEAAPLNLVLALDTSRSVSEAGLDHLRRASHAVLAGLKPDDLAALITFSHAVVQRTPLTGERDRLRAALTAIGTEGETALIDASQAAMILAESGTGRGLVVIFSDGLDTSSWLTRDLVLATARRSEAVVYGVAVGRVHDDFLGRLTDLTGGRLLRAETTERVRALFLQVLDEFRHRYVVSYSPRGVERAGWHRLSVRIKGRRATIRARPGYYNAQLPTPNAQELPTPKAQRPTSNAQGPRNPNFQRPAANSQELLTAQKCRLGVGRWVVSGCGEAYAGSGPTSAPPRKRRVAGTPWSGATRVRGQNRPDPPPLANRASELWRGLAVALAEAGSLPGAAAAIRHQRSGNPVARPIRAPNPRRARAAAETVRPAAEGGFTAPATWEARDGIGFGAWVPLNTYSQLPTPNFQRPTPKNCQLAMSRSSKTRPN